jgi:putative Holliday junction resolvase
MMAVTSGMHGNYLALDVGAARVGVSLASAVARLPHPYKTLPNDSDLWQKLQDICKTENVAMVVVGLPRGLDGQETEQTAYCREFAETAKEKLQTAVALQDEALTSHKASQELDATRKAHRREDIDALAATYILEDYLLEHGAIA